MSDEEFWSLIKLLEGDKGDDGAANLDPLIDALVAKGKTGIEGFFDTLSVKAYALDTRAHYRSFAFFSGSADPFLYARLAVIAQGEAFYGSVLQDPKKFPSRSDTRYRNEALLYVADDAYEKATGQDFEREARVSLESFSNDEGWAK